MSTRTARHARTESRARGPVTAAFAVIQSPRRGGWAARAWPAIPPLALLRPLLSGHGPGPWADAVLGFDAVLCLIACLAVTPFITVARLRISRLRWWYGMWMFAIGLAAVTIHAVVPPDGSLGYRLAGSAVNWTGVAIVVLLLPMAATSSAAAQKLLGPEWKRWQRGLVWAVWVIVGVHLGLLHDWLFGIGFLAASLPAIAIRRPRLRKAVKSWRSGGYSTGGMWAVMAVAGTLFAFGISVLATGEAVSVVRALAPGS